MGLHRVHRAHRVRRAQPGRPLRPLVALAALIPAAVVAPLALNAPPAAHAAVGGRVQFDTPSRTLDTRVGPSPSSPGTFPVPALGQVTLLPGDEDGEAYVHPCGEPRGPLPAVVYAGGQQVTVPLASDVDRCLTTTAPTDVIADRWGSISEAPSTDGLQYVPLDDPARAFVGSASSGSSQAIPLPMAPADAGGVVVALDRTDAEPEVFAFLAGCTGPALVAFGLPPWSPGPALAYLPIDPLDPQICLRSGGGPVQIDVLGYLEEDGPDPTRLPPRRGFETAEFAPPGLEPITPTRVLDTRTPLGVPVAGKLAAGQEIVLDLSERLTPDSTAAVLNVAVTEPDADGFITAYPCDAPERPLAANLNYVTGETVSNLVTVKLALDGTVCLFSYATTHLVADLSGTYEFAAGAGIQPVQPFRLLDTRDGTGAPARVLGAGETLTLQVAGRGGAPTTGVEAVTMNVAAVDALAAGFITAYPCDQPRPLAANLNYVAGQIVPNAVTVRVSPAGTVCLYAYAPTHLVADLSAWFGSDNADGFMDLVPERFVDTRAAIGTGLPFTVPAGQTLTVQITGRGQVPAGGASAVTMNVTAIGPAADGFLTAYPCDGGLPLAANLNYVRGEIVSNQVTVKLSAAGTVCFYAQRTTDIVADVAGYFSATPVTGIVFGVIDQ